MQEIIDRLKDNPFLTQILLSQLTGTKTHHSIDIRKFHKGYWDSDNLTSDGKIVLQKTEFWLSKPWDEFRAYLHWQAQYFLPTLESVAFIKELITDECSLDDAMEIGAGNGWLGYHLGIKMTDSMVQSDDAVKLKYDTAQQPTINYGKDVEKAEASIAVRKYKPHTVIGSWITQKFKDETDVVGSEWGVDEEDIIDNCKRYILIGSTNQHNSKRILKRKHIELKHPSLISRSKDNAMNRIWIFHNRG